MFSEGLLHLVEFCLWVFSQYRNDVFKPLSAKVRKTLCPCLVAQVMVESRSLSEKFGQSTKLGWKNQVKQMMSSFSIYFLKSEKKCVNFLCQDFRSY